MRAIFSSFGCWRREQRLVRHKRVEPGEIINYTTSTTSVVRDHYSNDRMPPSNDNNLPYYNGNIGSNVESSNVNDTSAIFRLEDYVQEPSESVLRNHSQDIMSLSDDNNLPSSSNLGSNEEYRAP